MQKLIVVYNPQSSQYVHVRTEVLNKLPQLKGFLIGKYTIQKTNFSDNVEKLSQILKDDDLVVSAGGDATAAICLNAILKSRKDAILAVLPYGNFNDLARTLKTSRFEDIFCSAKINNLPIKKLYPLDILVDKKHFRFASCYVTIGMTAAAVHIFDEPKIRRSLQKGRRNSYRSYFNLASWYFKNRHKKKFLPEFKLNGVLVSPKISDYAAVSGRSMAKVMKGGNDYLKPEVFKSATEKTVSFWPLMKLMIKSILYRTPGTETKGDKLEFLKPATITLQAEGEYQTFTNVSQIEILKTPQFVRVIDRS